MLILVIPVLNLLFRYLVDERLGGILLSAMLAHSAWHWMLDRGGQLSQFSFQVPVFDSIFAAALMRWGMLLIVVFAALWIMYEIFSRLALISASIRKSEG